MSVLHSFTFSVKYYLLIIITKQVSFVLAVTSGVNNTGKSTLIKSLGLQELKYDVHRM